MAAPRRWKRGRSPSAEDLYLRLRCESFKDTVTGITFNGTSKVSPGSESSRPTKGRASKNNPVLDPALGNWLCGRVLCVGVNCNPGPKTCVESTTSTKVCTWWFCSQLIASNVQQDGRNLTWAFFCSTMLNTGAVGVPCNTNVLRFSANHFPITWRRISRGGLGSSIMAGDGQGEGLDSRGKLLNGLS